MLGTFATMKSVRRLRKNKNKNKSYKSIWIILVIGFLWISFNKAGIFKWLSLYSHKQTLINEIKDLQMMQGSIKEHNNKLEDDLTYIEFLAYSKYKMVKPGEKIFRIQDSKIVEEESSGK